MAYLIADAELKPGQSVLILGVGGGIGNAALHWPLRWRHVILTSHSAKKLAMAIQLGADYRINCGTGDVAGEVRNLTTSAALI